MQIATGAGTAIGQVCRPPLPEGAFASIPMNGCVLPHLFEACIECLPTAAAVSHPPQTPAHPPLQGVAGFMGPKSGWRAPFLVVGFPTVALAVAMMFLVPEPRRGQTEAVLRAAHAEGSYDERITWEKAKQVVRIPSNVLMILQGLPGSLPWGMLLVYLTDYLAQDRGLGVTRATSVLLAFGIGGAVGVIGGGVGGQWLYNRRREWMALWMAGGVLLGIPPTLYLVNGSVNTDPFAGVVGPPSFPSSANHAAADAGLLRCRSSSWGWWRAPSLPLPGRTYAPSCSTSTSLRPEARLPGERAAAAVCIRVPHPHLLQAWPLGFSLP